MTPVLTKDKDYLISLIRLTAMLFIFSCHILQKYNNILGGWFDCGVQMFFFISGFLYATKNIENIYIFYKHRFIKILTDYYVYIVLLFTILFIFNIKFNFIDLYNTIILFPHFSGLGHLWFIRYILVCYLILPVILCILNKLDKLDCKFYLVNVLIISVLLELIFSGIFRIRGSWLVCFFLGTTYKRIIDQKYFNILIFNICVVILALLFSGFRIICYYNIINVGDKLYDYIWQYCHIFLGISIAITLRYIYLKFFINLEDKLTKLLNTSDRYSYDFYIVHYFYIIHFNCLHKLVLLDTLVIFLISCLSTYILNFSSKYIKNFINKLEKRGNNE